MIFVLNFSKIKTIKPSAALNFVAFSVFFKFFFSFLKTYDLAQDQLKRLLNACIVEELCSEG